MGQYELPISKRRSFPAIDLSDPKYDEIINDMEKGEMISPLEDAIDAHILRNKMNMDDTFSVLHSNGEIRAYKYLGPNSGGRKDWMMIKPREPVPTS